MKYRVVYVVLHEEMSFEELEETLVSKIDNSSNYMKVEIFAYIGSRECLEKDLDVKNDNDVRWVYHTISFGVNNTFSLIVQYVGSMGIIVGSSRVLTVTNIDNRDEGEYFFSQDIDLSKVSSNVEVKMHDMFSAKIRVAKIIVSHCH